MRMIVKTRGAMHRSCVLALVLMSINPSISAMDSRLLCDAGASEPKVTLPSNDMIGDDREFMSKKQRQSDSHEITLGDVKSGKQQDSSISTSQKISMPQDLIPVHSTRKGMSHKPLWTAQQKVSEPDRKKQTREVKAHRIEMSKKISQFKNKFSSLKKEELFEKHMTELKNSAEELYRRRLLKIFLGREVLLRTSDAKIELPEEIGERIFLNVIDDTLSSFETVVRGFAQDPAKYKNEKERLMISQWSDVVIDYFHDLKKLELVSPGIFSEFEENDKGQLLASLITAKYPQIDAASAYLNFDLRLSIAEDPNLKDEKLKEIFQGLDEKKWEQVEYQFRKFQLTSKETEASFGNFEQIKKEFLTKTSPGSSHSVPEMEKLLKDIISYIPTVKFDEDNQDQVLIHLNSIYHMLKIIQRQHPEIISNGSKKTITFYQLRAFEEAVEIEASLNHVMYQTSRIYLQNINETYKRNTWQQLLEILVHPTLYKLDEFKENLKGSVYLTDSNTNRRISKFYLDAENKEVAIAPQILEELKQSSSFQRFSYVFEKQLRGTPEDRYFVKGGQSFVELRQKARKQYLRYLIELNNLKDHEIEENKKFSKFVEKFESIISDKFQQSEEEQIKRLDKYHSFFNLSVGQANILFL